LQENLQMPRRPAAALLQQLPLLLDLLRQLPADPRPSPSFAG
jgi:hypothetical protein